MCRRARSESRSSTTAQRVPVDSTSAATAAACGPAGVVGGASAPKVGAAPARGTRDVADDAYYAGAGSDPAHGCRSANVGDLAARGSSRPRFFSELDDRLYFAADGDGGRGAELWASLELNQAALRRLVQ